MADLHLLRGTDGDFDLDFNGSDLVLDHTLETSAAISVFTWARRGDEDPDPTPGADRMGWWGTYTLEPPGWELGSKIWLALRSNPTPAVVQQIENWTRDAFAWALRDGAATAVSVSLERTPPPKDRTALVVGLTRPGGRVESYTLELNWNTQTPNGSP